MPYFINTCATRVFGAPAGRVAVIGISGRANAAEEAASRAAGMNGYLAKPISPAALMRLLVTARA